MTRRRLLAVMAALAVAALVAGVGVVAHGRGLPGRIAVYSGRLRPDRVRRPWSVCAVLEAGAG